MENRCNYIQHAYGVINKYQRFSNTYFEYTRSVPVLIAEKFIEFAKDNGELNRIPATAFALPIFQQYKKRPCVESLIL